MLGNEYNFEYFTENQALEAAFEIRHGATVGDQEGQTQGARSSAADGRTR